MCEISCISDIKHRVKISFRNDGSRKITWCTNTKLPACIIILISAILLFISTVKEYISNKYYSEYERVLKENSQDIGHQMYYLRKAHEYSPSNAEILFELGRSYIKEKSIGKSKKDRDKSYELAKIFFQEALICKPTDGKHYARYAWYLGYSGETNEAIEYFEKAINLGMTSAYIHRLYAMWCVNQIKSEVNLKDTGQFVDVYKSEQRKAEILKSYDNRFMNGVSISAMLKKAKIEWEETLSLRTGWNLQEASVIASWHQDTHNSLADLNLLRCEIDEAIDYYGKADNKIMLANCYYIKEDYKNTVSILGSIIKEGGSTFRRNKQNTKKLLMDVVKHNPGNYLAFYWLGEIYTQFGKNREAIVNLKRVVELKPEHTDTHLKLAKLYKLTGESELAINEYEMVLSQNPRHKEAAYLLSETIREMFKDTDLMAK